MQAEEFLDFLYEGLQGFSCIATVDHEDKWHEEFAKWPDERGRLLGLIQSETAQSKHVYISPMLFKEKRRARDAFHVCQVSWSDYDDGLQEEIHPHLVVMTSPGRYHAYWKLAEPITRNNASLLEQKNKSHKGHDKGTWDLARVLRVPYTVNGKNGWLAKPVNLGPVNYLKTDLQELFYGPAPKDRSSALFRIGRSLVESGTNREAVEGILRDADNRWGKFVGRADAEQRLTELIDRVFQSANAAADAIVVPTLGYSDFRGFSGAGSVVWLLEGFLYQGALGAIAGPPGIGKTQFSLRLAFSLCLGRGFLKWNKAEDLTQRVLFLSYELGVQEVQKFLEDMADVHQHSAALNESLFIQATGYSQSWTDKEVQQQIEELIVDKNITGIIVDALGSTTSASLNDDAEVKAILDFADRLRSVHGVWIIFIHHTRKPASGGKITGTLADLYGNQYIGGRVRTALILTRPDETERSILSVNMSKMSFAPETPEFFIKRTAVLDFDIFDGYAPPGAKSKRSPAEDAKGLIGKFIDEDEDTDDSGFGL